jgi:hypothetical protein
LVVPGAKLPETFRLVGRKLSAAVPAGTVRMVPDAEAEACSMMPLATLRSMFVTGCPTVTFESVKPETTRAEPPAIAAPARASKSPATPLSIDRRCGTSTRC